ncbi:DUF502 domain-containing protein [Oscillatoria salina]|uniref:DUF502 domain-containing protein n=1 Tax=Oscillatoria salina TaxID=331517 RepID=UPI0013BA417C|nr:DUF502 domain-containing protein [Oscillatoria salina]MBZ8182993.1 DUF502 domain-containing protein [Oscillatoria salina IIICB1]NET86501.1 DUF502 domain-containing protein [Kamptonema sp. SIO1D9]
MIQRLKQNLKNDLIAGLLVVIPLATTIWLTYTISTWVIDFLTRIPKQLNPFDSLHPILTNLLNLVVGLAVPLTFILLIGLMARNIVGRWLLDVGERVLQAIPFAGSIYKTLKQLLETLLKDSNNKFRRVVLVEYPRRGMWAIAFVTGGVSNELQPDLSDEMISLFIPTTPNPTTGWYAIVPESDVINLSLSIEDAFKVLISGGIVTPTNTMPISLPDNYQNHAKTPLSQLSEEKRQAIPLEEER